MMTRSAAVGARRRRAASVLLGLVLVAPVLLAGCSDPLDPEPARSAIPTGCGGCRVEVAALVETLEQTPGVDAVRSARRTTRGVEVAHLDVSLGLAGADVVSTDVGAVLDAVAEAVWRSGISPLDELGLDVELRDGYRESTGFAFGRERAAYEQRWGRRPPGTEWSPVPDDEGAEGCELDGCPELMRAIAREASALPGVEAVLASGHVSSSPTNATSADIVVRTDGTDPSAQVVEQVVEVVWRSRVTPLEWIEVSTVTPSGGFPDSVRLCVAPRTGEDRDRLEELWGPRPVRG